MENAGLTMLIARFDAMIAANFALPSIIHSDNEGQQAMKTWLPLCALLVSAFVFAADPPAPTQAAPTVLKGKILEVKDVESYTYLRLKTQNGEVWAAIGKVAVKVGNDIAIDNVMLMKNFESKSLNKKFETIYFGQQAGSAPAAAVSHGSAALPVAAGPIRVSKAVGPNARTVAEIATKGAELKDKPILVRGQVVKFTGGVMGKNWVHLQDGSGSAADKSNDILITTLAETKVGEVISLKGVVRTDKDFGAGYAYKVLVEDATIQP